MFLDIVELRKNSCCGYSYIIRLVDPSDRRGNAAPLKSLLLFDIISSITSLLNGMRKQPSEILYDWDFQPELLQLLKV